MALHVFVKIFLIECLFPKERSRFCAHSSEMEIDEELFSDVA